MEFINLPLEIHILIAEQSGSDRAINSLARTNRTFHQLLNLILDQRNAKRKKGRSALVWAAKHDMQPTAQLALKYHNPLKKTKPLLVAAKNGHNRIVQLLLAKKGVNIKAKATDKDKYTALELAVMGNHGSVVKQLLDAGANINPRKTSGRIRHRQSQSPLLFALSSHLYDAARPLIESGRVDLERGNRWGKTALSLAARCEAGDMVQCLLAAGANPNFYLHPPSSPLNRAVFAGYVDIIKVLLAHGADPNVAFGDNQHTSIFIAILIGRLEFVRTLVESGVVDVSHLDGADDTPLSFALTRGRADIASVLLRKARFST
ncbi:ankyrin repeat-containing domain protein [Aspergillus cavernicola]|uniref:Ankyrin repeat-containing domain protein n=1 Tax=Aspergillus cavernicola TaxID=176166 RepID=A0ABR4HLU1_9EURO